MFIREATEGDLPEIVRIYNSTVAGRMVTADTEPVPVGSRLAWFREHKPGHRPLWVMVDEGRVIAWLSFQSFYGRPAYHGTVEVSLYVAPESRQKGVGSAMLTFALTQCPALGIKTLLGFIFGHNEPSLRLFKKFGFEEWGYMPRIAELDGVERDLAIVGKRIDA